MVGGGFKAIWYSLKAAWEVGLIAMWRAVFSKNSCKTCAFGMGGQQGGMVNEAGHFPEICKKSFQAQITDIQKAIPTKLFAEKSIEEFKNTKARLLERTGRLNTPLYKQKGDSHYHPISWDEAIKITARRYQETTAERTFFYSSGRSSNEAAFLLQLFARLYGTNNVNNCSYYCHQASGVGMKSTVGTGTATIRFEDLSGTDLIFVMGANPASNHPRFMRQLQDCRRRGGDVIIINPAKEKGLIKFAIPSDFESMASGGSEIASYYLQPNIGGDIALLKGIAKAVLEYGKHDIDFIKSHTNNSANYIEDIENIGWEEIIKSSGISQNKIEEIALLYGNTQRVVFSWAMGITHHTHGVENVESIVNLALLRGMVGKRFAGLLPLRGHSNVQGIGSVGVTPKLTQEFFENLEQELGIKLPASLTHTAHLEHEPEQTPAQNKASMPGKDTMACTQAAAKGEIDIAFLLGGNLYNSSPDSTFTTRALGNISFKIFLNTTLNHGHFYGVEGETLILPVAARDEERQKTTQESMFSFVRLSDGGIVRLDNVRSEVEIICDIAAQTLALEAPAVVDFIALKDHVAVRRLISKVVPGYGEIAKIDETKQEFQLAGRTFYTPDFATIDGRGNFKVCAIPVSTGKGEQLRMMTVRSEGQFNSIVYEEGDLYRGQTERWVVLMNEQDMRDRNLQDNDFVTLQSEVGEMKNVKTRLFDIPAGNLITYYPESNVLVPNTTDPRSLTPGFKSVWVTLS